ncbi:MAG TPA: recombinase family protein [Bryobacteraceae bacterium]|nr:recombinase family protein [Bryobacteraceae bacterium]
MKESLRDVITGEVSLEYFVRRFSEGWKIASIEWFKEALAESSAGVDQQTALPYGLKVSGNCVVEENPLESTVLLLILEQIIREKRITEIAVALNEQGLPTRAGTAWSPTDVFNLLPRLIEAGPSLLKSPAWQERRPNLHSSVPQTN